MTIESDLEDFREMIAIEDHIMADVEGTKLPEEVQASFEDIESVYSQDKSTLRKAIDHMTQERLTRAFITFRKFLKSFPLEQMEKLYVYCYKNSILSENQLDQFKSSLEVFEEEGNKLEQELLERSLEVGRKRVQNERDEITINKKAIRKAFHLTSVYQLQKDKECAGVFKYETNDHKVYAEDFRGLNNEEKDYNEYKVDYSDEFRSELSNVEKNHYILMHSHPLMGSEMGFIAHRPSEQDLKFFRNHNSQFAAICPLQPDFLSSKVGLSIISLKNQGGFDFLPVKIQESDRDVTHQFNSVNLYNNILYLLSTAGLDDQSSDQAMGSIQFMLGEDVLRKLQNL